MTPAELNTIFFQAVLYYCNQNGDMTIYNTDLSNVGTYDTDPVSGYLYMTSWAIDAYPMPTNSTLELYTLDAVNTFYNTTYSWPQSISEVNQQAFFHLSTTDLESVVVDSNFTGYLAYDTSTQQIKRYDGSAWVSLW